MSTAKNNPALLNPDDAAILLIDHQSGLFQTVHDQSVAQLRTNVTALAKTASLMNIPIVTTASVPEGPNGPHMPEIKEHAPHSIFIERHGEINAWDNPDFVQAVKDTGKNTLLIAGVWTSVCVAFPSISAKSQGFNVYAVIDASGDSSTIARDVTVARLSQAGVIPINTTAIIAELQVTWNRQDAFDFAQIYGGVAPNYTAVMESYAKAQEATAATT